MVVSAHTNRVPVVDGHTMTVSVALDNRRPPADVAHAMREWRGRPQELRLPSAPPHPIEVLDGRSVRSRGWTPSGARG